MMLEKMNYTLLMILFALVLTAELRVIEVIRSNADRKEHSSENDEFEQKSFPQEKSALKSALQNKIFDNYAGKLTEVNNRAEEMADPFTQDNSNASNILQNFVKNVRRHIAPEATESSERVASSDDEIMETAEMYLRPLSRYRELQEKKKNQSTKSINQFASESKTVTLLSKLPEYCLPAKGGLICFYQV